MDIVRALQKANAGRDPERLRIKFARMRSHPFVFLRGSAALFHARIKRLGGAGGRLLGSAPPAWCCGDMHLENFGSYRGANGLSYFDINDFDEAALAPAVWDPLHLLTSLWLAADELRLSAADAWPLARAVVDAYADALADGKPYWLERQTAHGAVRALLDQVTARTMAELLARRTTGSGRRRRLRVDGRHALPASAADAEAVRLFMAQAGAALGARFASPDHFKVLDVARRVAGTGSLGLDRYVLLVHGEGGAAGQRLLDLKPAQPSSLARVCGLPQPRWPSEAHRMVQLQQRMQAVSMDFVEPVRLGSQAYVLRGLQPGEDRLDLAALAAHGRGHSLLASLADMGRLIAWAQLRSCGRQGSASADELIDFGQRGRRPGKWRDRLIELSSRAADQVRADAAVFSAAVADGAFDV